MDVQIDQAKIHAFHDMFVFLKGFVANTTSPKVTRHGYIRAVEFARECPPCQCRWVVFYSTPCPGSLRRTFKWKNKKMPSTLRQTVESVLIGQTLIRSWMRGEHRQRKKLTGTKETVIVVQHDGGKGRRTPTTSREKNQADDRRKQGEPDQNKAIIIIWIPILCDRERA